MQTNFFGELILKLYLTTLSKKGKTSTKYVHKLVRIIEKQSNIVTFTENGKEIVTKTVTVLEPMLVKI